MLHLGLFLVHMEDPISIIPCINSDVFFTGVTDSDFIHNFFLLIALSSDERSKNLRSILFTFPSSMALLENPEKVDIADAVVLPMPGSR